MASFPFTLIAEAGSALTASRIVAAVVWTGLGLLTISLMILMRTRWGQAKPISKCVALSVLAHILLLGYAYTTRLIFDVPPAVGDGVIRVALSTGDESESPTRPERPWDEPPSDFQVAPELLSPDRAESPISLSQPGSSIPEFLPLPLDPPPDLVAELPAAPKPTETHIPQPPKPVPSPLPPPERIDDAAIAELNMPPAQSNVADVAPPAVDASDAGENPLAQTPVPELQDVEITPIGEAVLSQADNALLASARPEQSVGQPLAAGWPEPLQPVRPPQRRGDPPGRTNQRMADGAPLPKIYELRRSRDRLAMIELHGGNRQTEQAVNDALAWFARNQEADGRWAPQRFGAGREIRVLGHDRDHAGSRADTGLTGLALLTFLAAGHTHLEGDYRDTVQRGLNFLAAQQADDGNLAGPAKLFARMYCHGMATLAVCEALAMTGDPQLRPCVERAVRYTLDSQDPTTGGWRYQPGDRDGDMSQFGWQVMALKSAEMAGLATPSQTRSGMLRFLRSVSQGQHLGLASYRPNASASRTMTAEALACRYFLNVQQDYRSINEATLFLSQERPDISPGKPNLYYWYYATLALRQSESEAWRQWNASLQQALLSRQETSGDQAGSWSPDTVWGSYGGRVYSTALATLCLEVYYRYLPVYQVDDGLRSAGRTWQPARTLR